MHVNFFQFLNEIWYKVVCSWEMKKQKIYNFLYFLKVDYKVDFII